VFFQRDDPETQQFAALFKIGRGIIGPFSKVAHGSTEFEGGRAILGAYVDRRIVKFCLAYEWKDKTWVPRTKERYEELKSMYDAFVEEHQL
jgi:hypothetical protein